MTHKVQPPKDPYYNKIEHERYRHTVIRTIASCHQAETGSPIPEYVMMLGKDWMYLAHVSNFGGPADHPRIGEAIKTERIKLYGISDRVTTSKALTDLYSKIKEITLIPEGEERMQEARDLGEILEEQEHFFRVKRGDQEILVCRMRDARYIVDEKIRTQDGKQIGITEVKPPKK